MMVGNYLEEALEKSGRFRAVTRELTADAPVVFGGRVVAIEEVDRSRTLWIGPGDRGSGDRTGRPVERRSIGPDTGVADRLATCPVSALRRTPDYVQSGQSAA